MARDGSPLILLDGASGHELKRRLDSIDSSCSTPEATLAAQKLHEEYIDAGASVICTNTFLCTMHHISDDEDDDEDDDDDDDMNAWHQRSEKLQRSIKAGVRAALLAVQGNERVRVAGCVPPLGECYVKPAVDEEESLKQYTDIVRAMLMSTKLSDDDGQKKTREMRNQVDIVLAETLSTSAEACAILRALDTVLTHRETEIDGDTGIPRRLKVPEVWVSFTLDDGDEIERSARDGTNIPQLRGGELLRDAIDAVMRVAATLHANVTPRALLLNCSSMDVSLDALRVLREESDQRRDGFLIGIYPNAFNTPTGTWLRGGAARDAPSGSCTLLVPEKEFAHILTLARDAGASIIGGCCGTTPSYMRVVYNSLLYKSS